MAKLNSATETPLYGLDSFSAKANDSSFYIETLQVHLANHKFVSKPHRHNFYLLLYITNGGGEHTIDFKTYPIEPGSFFLMTPGQVHSWNLEPDTNGYIIFFTQAFYRMQFNANSLMEFPFFHSLQASPLIQLEPDHTIDVVVKEMQKEFRSSNAVIDLRILRSYLDLLLLKLARLYPNDESDESAIASTSKLRKLEQLIDKHFVKLKLPSEYADLMNLSPSYLNNICKQKVGKTLTDLITERVILEAKRYFAHSDLTVNQVSDKLNFSSASYFIRFFRKHTGITPEQFKKSLNRTIQ
ncbi:MAG: AraC family transcriptional regulator [Chryseolinea sp.]